MPKTSTKAEFNVFVKGIISEASPLNFPENASLDEQNFELNRDGTRRRRLGMDIESGGVLKSILNTQYLSQYVPLVFKWLDAGTQPEADFLVTQEGNTLHIFKMTVDNISLDGYITSIVLDQLPMNAEYSLSAVDGRLVAVCGDAKIAIVSYENNSFSVEYQRLKTRDLWGVDELNSKYETDISYRGPLDIRHYYNLQNQSWGIPRKNSSGTLIDPIQVYLSEYNVAPSNSEAVWAGLQFQPVSGGADPFERIYPKLYAEVLGASIKSAKGYFIIDVMDRGASREQAFADNYTKYPSLIYPNISLPKDRTLGGASVINEFAGRIFYAGFTGDILDPMDRSPNLSNYVFFSQLVKNKQDYVKCYQEGDPTSRESSDIIDTDGGFIRISGANRIIGIATLGNAQIVLATNGVWSIVGGNDYGFSATNYRVDKLSSFGCISRKSIVSDGSKLFFWADDGIYVVGPTQNGGLAVSSVTEQTIQRKYQEIDNQSKTTASGVYDGLTKKIRWVYHTGTLFSSSNKTYELVLDLVLGSFYINQIFSNSAREYEVICGIDTNRYTITNEFDNVVANADNVVANSDQVVYRNTKRKSPIQNVRYLFLKKTETGYQYSFAYYKNSSFKDWGIVDAKGYLLTGAINATDSSLVKQIPYLLTMMRSTETSVDVNGILQNQSGCKMQFVWDWTNTPDVGRWSNEQQVYRLSRVHLSNINELSSDTGFDVIVTKTKIRGQGRAFSVLFSTEEAKDCQILGWNISLNATAIT